MTLDPNEIQRALEQTTIIRPPRQPLATFGVTSVTYHLVTEPILAETGADARDVREAVIRTGTLTANRPQLVTPAYLLNLFRGFEHGQEFAGYLRDTHGPSAPGLLYSYQNELRDTNVVSDPPDVVAGRIADELDRNAEVHAAVIRGDDMLWDVSLMKFIHDLTVSSLGQTIGDFGRQGLLQMDSGVPRGARARIDEMFMAVRAGELDPHELKSELDRWDLFDEYEDRFFALFRKP